MWNPFEKISGFYKAVVSDLSKCTWPTWEELYESTVLVITSSLVLSLFVLVVDLFIRNIVSFLT
ncbi:MAG: preprotein translocase subunit SecE [Lentisphaeria bacterium]|nr:preprotein translocase subunit SecE [Lentisphaeria bacterium]